jgi:hypothetical protein
VESRGDWMTKPFLNVFFFDLCTAFKLIRDYKQIIIIIIKLQGTSKNHGEKR